MALLGYYIDQVTVSRAGDDLSGLTLTTLAHSLPLITVPASGAGPDATILQMRSMQAQGHNPPVNLLALGANASLLTIGYRVASTASCPTFMFRATSIVYHSSIR